MNRNEKSTEQREIGEPDLLLALMLERKKAAGLTYAELAAGMGLAECTVRRMFGRSPWDWENRYRSKACRVLGISREQVQRSVRI